MQIAPSVLAANHLKLEEDILKVSPAEYIHLDIMDGHFVPNISFGPGLVKALRPLTEQSFDVHLMLEKPLGYIEAFVNAGADIISFHIECGDNPQAVIDKIKELGVKPAMTLKPGTKVESLFPYCNQLFMVLVMTVEPGFGGQSLMAEQLEKAKILKEKFPHLLIEADGGIGRDNIELCAKMGVDICVAGTSVFGEEDPSAEIRFLQSAGK